MSSAGILAVLDHDRFGSNQIVMRPDKSWCTLEFQFFITDNYRKKIRHFAVCYTKTAVLAVIKTLNRPAWSGPLYGLRTFSRCQGCWSQMSFKFQHSNAFTCHPLAYKIWYFSVKVTSSFEHWILDFEDFSLYGYFKKLTRLKSKVGFLKN